MAQDHRGDVRSRIPLTPPAPVPAAIVVAGISSPVHTVHFDAKVRSV
jgi:hypothetical protein